MHSIEIALQQAETNAQIAVDYAASLLGRGCDKEVLDKLVEFRNNAAEARAWFAQVLAGSM